MNLKLITAPAIEPVTLAEVKLSGRISHDVEDDLLTSWIASARIAAENFQHRAYINQVWEMSFDGFPCLPLCFPRPPLLQLMSISYFETDNSETQLYYDGTNPVTTTEEGGAEPETNGDFIIDRSGDPGRLGHAYLKTWPSVVLRPIDAVRVRFAAGYGLEASDVPQSVRDAIILYCTWRNENRAGEIEKIPEHFFNLLRPERM